METVLYVVLAYGVVWTGLFIFLLQIYKRLAAIDKKLNLLKQANSTAPS